MQVLKRKSFDRPTVLLLSSPDVSRLAYHTQTQAETGVSHCGANNIAIHIIIRSDSTEVASFGDTRVAVTLDQHCKCLFSKVGPACRTSTVQSTSAEDRELLDV